MQPGRKRVGRRAHVPPPVRGGIRVARVGAGRVEGVGGVGDAGIDAAVGREVELRGVGVVGVVVGGALDGALLGGREGAEEGGDVVPYRGRVGAGEVDGVGEPAFVEVPGALDGGGVGGGGGEGDFVAAVVLVGDVGVRDEGFTEVVGLRVGEEDGVAAVEGLLFLGDGGVFEVVRWEGVLGAEDDGCGYRGQLSSGGLSRMQCRARTFIDGIPPLHPVTEGVEGDAGVVDKVPNDLLGEPAAVGVHQSQGRIPVIERHNRRDVILEASVDDIVVVVDGELVDGASSERQDAAPREGERIRLHAHRGDSGDVCRTAISDCATLGHTTSISPSLYM